MLLATLEQEEREALGRVRGLEGQWCQPGNLLEGETVIPERDLGINSGLKSNLKQCLEGSCTAKQDRRDLSSFLVLLEGVLYESLVYFVSLSRPEASLYLRAYLLLYYLCIL